MCSFEEISVKLFLFQIFWVSHNLGHFICGCWAERECKHSDQQGVAWRIKVLQHRYLNIFQQNVMRQMTISEEHRENYCFLSCSSSTVKNAHQSPDKFKKEDSLYLTHDKEAMKKVVLGASNHPSAFREIPGWHARWALGYCRSSSAITAYKCCKDMLAQSLYPIKLAMHQIFVGLDI